MVNQEVLKALDKAKIGLMCKPDSTFFTTLCFSLKQHVTHEVPTAGTDGTNVYYNPDFFMGLDPDERIFLLVHEAMHVALLHIIRRGDRDAGKWNKAADYVINLMLVQRGFKMPKDGLLDYQYADMDTVQVYDLLPDDPTSSCPMQDLMALPASEGEGTEGPGQQIEKHEQTVQDILVRATLQSKMSGDKPGTIPGAIQIFLDKLLNPILPWDTLLRRYMLNLAKTDYSWRKPNRRYMPDHYLPTLHGEALDHIAVAVDTSASVSNAEFLRFISEIQGILQRLKPKKISLIQFDTQIKSINTVTNSTELGQVTFHGRGGTRIQEVIEWTKTHKPVVMVIFSDGEFRHSMLDPKRPILWMIHGNPGFTAPYGKCIHYTV